mgnify:CR=1 FL=1
MTFVILSCQKNGEIAISSNKKAQSPEPNLPTLPARAKDHSWYAFSNGGFVKASLPQNSAIQSMKPWTESVRISAGATGLDGNGYMLVNHVGALIFEKKENPTIINDKQLLSKSTASNLIFSGGNAYFTLSKNALFNRADDSGVFEQGANGSNRPYLVRISTESKMLYPCITYGDLGIASGEEIAGSRFNGNEWISAIKSEEIDAETGEDKVEFRFIRWDSLQDFATLSAQTRPGKIILDECSEENYLEPNRPKDFSKAPERLKNLLSSIPDSFDYSVSLRLPGGSSPELFSHGSMASPTEARAIIAEDWICAIFADGTTYFSGAIGEGKHTINGGKTVAFRLPKLPKNYFYTDFCLSDNILVVGWEENDFYKTGRSGFLTVNMAALFR